MSDQILPADDPPSSVLLLTPGFATDDGPTCRTLTAVGTPETSNVLWVSYTDPPSRKLAAFIDEAGTRPANAAGIAVSDSSDSGGEQLDSVDTINAPGDLTGLGIAITEQLQALDDENTTVVCFDSITALLQYVEIETAYEFLHVLVGRLYDANAVAHFHLNPDAHDDQTVEQLKTLFDAMVVKQEGEEATLIGG